jgi:hypothetical protein
MDSGRRFPPRAGTVSTDGGTVERSGSGCVDWPCKGVGFGRDLMPTARGDPSGSFVESTRKKSSDRKGPGRPYRKPTQVGKASSLR